jgi:hypothetical protein
MIAEFLLTSKAKVFAGIILVYFALIATDNISPVHKAEIEKPKTDTLKTIKSDSLKMDIRKTIEEAKRAVTDLKRATKKT